MYYGYGLGVWESFVDENGDTQRQLMVNTDHPPGWEYYKDPITGEDYIDPLSGEKTVINGYYSVGTEFDASKLFVSISFSAFYYQVSDLVYPILSSALNYFLFFGVQDELLFNEELAGGLSGPKVSEFQTWCLNHGMTIQEINQVKNSSTTRKDFFDNINLYIKTL